jgi:hypothetical protein
LDQKQTAFWSSYQFKVLSSGTWPILDLSEREVDMKVPAECDSHGRRDSNALTLPGGGAAGIPLRTPYGHAALQFAAGFGPRTPHMLRHSCAVNLPKKAEKTTRTCFGPDATILVSARFWQDSGNSPNRLCDLSRQLATVAQANDWLFVSRLWGLNLVSGMTSP